MVMENSESLERVLEGLSRAASCCREMAKMLDAHEWKDLSAQLIIMRQKVLKIYKALPLTEMEVLNLVANMEMAQKAAQRNTVH